MIARLAGQAFRAPDYRRLWLVGLFLNVARWVDLLALGWLALELTGSAMMVGLAAFFRAIPQLVLGPFGGSLADRLPRGRLLVVSQGLALSAAIGLAVLFGLGAGTYPRLLAIELILGAAWALDFPVRRTVIFTMVGAGSVTNAVSLETVSMQIAKMVGPALGGLLLGRLGPGACYAGLALLYVTALILSLRLRSRIGSAPAVGREPIAWRAGLAAVLANRDVRGVLAITIVMNVLVFPYQHVLSVFAREVYRVGPELLGLLVAADGLGALTAALAVAAQRGFGRHAHLFTGGSVLAALLLVGFAAAPSYGIALILLFAIGMAESGFATMQSAMVLLGAPAHLRGRAMGILSACIGTGPFGALWIGFIASRTGVRGATAASALLALALMAPVAARMLAWVGRPSPTTGSGERAAGTG